MTNLSRIVEIIYFFLVKKSKTLLFTQVKTVTETKRSPIIEDPSQRQTFIRPQDHKKEPFAGQSI